MHNQTINPMHPTKQTSYQVSQDSYPQLMRSLIALGLMLLISACATTPPDPKILDNAQAAITRAQSAGGTEHAPLELRLASRRLALAQEELDKGNTKGARHLADQAEIEAQLALARTRAALMRLSLENKRAEYEALKAELIELYGEEVLP